MAYDDIITRTDSSALMPEERSLELLNQVTEESAVMRVAKRLANMSRAQTRLPVISALPTAYFSSGDNSLIQTTDVDWTNKYIDAEELNVIVTIPKSVAADIEVGIWTTVEPYLREALGVAVDGAVLYGTGIPSSWTTNLGAAGLLALATAASHTVSLAAHTDLYEALLGETTGGTDGALMKLEADGFIATGHIAHVTMRGKMRNCRDADGNPIFAPGQNIGNTFATGTLDGSPILYPLNGSMVEASSLMFSGMWRHLLYAMRQDITISLSDQAVISGPNGTIVHNLFQQNMMALKATMRLGFALPNPINRMNTNSTTRCPIVVLTA